MTAALRRFAWISFLVIEIGLVAAGSAYVGIGTRDFWLLLASAVIATVAYAVATLTTPPPKLDETARAPQGWYWI